MKKYRLTVSVGFAQYVSEYQRTYVVHRIEDDAYGYSRYVNVPSLCGAADRLTMLPPDETWDSVKNRFKPDERITFCPTCEGYGAKPKPDEDLL